VPVRRPRVRTLADEDGVEREVRLESYDTLASVDLLADHMVASALAKAIREVFGEQAVIARCRVHKERNVLDHLPEGERLWVLRKLRTAWANPNAVEAEAALAALAGQLEKVNPDAAASLREGLADTLTVTRLGITGSLLETVMSTNPMESMIEIVREHARNVKHWQRGDMRLRWAAAGMLAPRPSSAASRATGNFPPSPPRSSAPSEPRPCHRRVPSARDRMINQEAATKFHGERVILVGLGLLLPVCGGDGVGAASCAVRYSAAAALCFQISLHIRSGRIIARPDWAPEPTQIATTADPVPTATVRQPPSDARATRCALGPGLRTSLRLERREGFTPGCPLLEKSTGRPEDA
jgi:hypothetical protein